MFPVKDKHIVIPMPGQGEYDIPLEKCESYEEIFAWVIQLADKTWVTGEIIRKFIATSLHEHGLSRPQV